MQEEYSVRATRELESQLTVARRESTHLLQETQQRSDEVLELRLQLTEAQKQHEQWESRAHEREAQARSAIACEKVDLQRKFREKLWSATKEMVANVTSQSDAQLRASMTRAYQCEVALEKTRAKQRSRVWAAQELVVSAALSRPRGGGSDEDVHHTTRTIVSAKPIIRSPTRKSLAKENPVEKSVMGKRAPPEMGSVDSLRPGFSSLSEDARPVLHDMVSRSPSTPRNKKSKRSKFSPHLSLGSLKNVIDDMINDESF